MHKTDLSKDLSPVGQSETMRHLFLSCIGLVTLFASPAIGSTPEATLVLEARERTYADVRYDPKYVKLDYPGGDVSADTGVCTDVIIRTFRNAFDFDFQKAVHEDMRANFSKYPTIWGHKRPDKNIDHRRVPNLETYLKRQGAAVPITKNAKDYLPGDIVTWRLGGSLPHIGIVSDKKSLWGTPLIIHNIGAGPVEDDLLFNTDIHGHFRFVPPQAVKMVNGQAIATPQAQTPLRAPVE